MPGVEHGSGEPSGDDEDDERDRRATNIFLLIAAVLFVGAGVWLVDALLAARKADDACRRAGAIARRSSGLCDSKTAEA